MIEATLGNPRFFSRSGPYPLAVVASTARGIANEVELLLEGVAPLQTAGRNDVSFLDNRRYAAGAAIHDFLLLFSVNRAGLYSYGSQKLVRRVWRGLRRWHQANPIGLAAAHARHHYDISTELYRLFLDDQMQYSCAYFRDPEHETLEQAQRNKLIHATSKLQLDSGIRLQRSAPAGAALPFIWRARPERTSPRSMFHPNKSMQHLCRSGRRFQSRRISRVGLSPAYRTV